MVLGFLASLSGPCPKHNRSIWCGHSHASHGVDFSPCPTVFSLLLWGQRLPESSSKCYLVSHLRSCSFTVSFLLILMHNAVQLTNKPVFPKPGLMASSTVSHLLGHILRPLSGLRKYTATLGRPTGVVVTNQDISACYTVAQTGMPRLPASLDHFRCH